MRLFYLVRTHLNINRGLSLALAVVTILLAVERIAYSLLMPQLVDRVFNGEYGMLSRAVEGFTTPQHLLTCRENVERVHHWFFWVFVALALTLLLAVLRWKSPLLESRDETLRERPLSGVKIAAFVVFLAVAFSVVPMKFLPEGVFLSGDGGMKYMHITSLVNSGFRTLALWPDAGDWARKIWDHYDSFPVKEPFVYHRDGRTYVQFPVLFVLCSSVFFLLLGFKGLYVLPILGTLGVCAVLAIAWRRHPWPVMRVLCAVVCTPVFFYTNLFWEHTLALPLVTGGLLLACMGRTGGHMLAAGAILGAGVFFRSEVFAVFPACLLLRLLREKKEVALFFGGLLGVLCLYGVFNVATQGALFPLQGIQMIRSPFVLAAQGLVNLSEMTTSIFTLTPCLVIALWAIPEGDRMNRTLVFMAVTSVILIAFITPNSETRDFGPRYLLVLMPLLAYLAVNATFRMKSRGVMALSGVLWALSFWNCGVGGLQVINGSFSQQVAPVTIVREAGGIGNILVGHQFIAQQFAWAGEGRNMVRVNDRNFKPIMSEMKKAGVRSALLVVYADARWGSFKYDGGEDIPYRGEVVGVFGAYKIVRLSEI